MRGKKLVSLTVMILALILIYSCGPDGEAPDINVTGAPVAEAEPEPELSDNLPDRDFGGYNFRIYLGENRYECMFVEELIGEIVNDAVFQRNRAVEERFNITISTVLHPEEWHRGMDGANAIRAGDDAFDLMLTHGRIAYQFAQQGLVIDWISSMPYVDLSQVWWNQDVLNDSTMFGMVFCVAGDISYRGLSATFCKIFNKELFQDLGIDFPYESVLDGTWTLDKFASILRMGAADLDGDGMMTPENDRFGLEIGNVWGFPTSILYIGGDRVIARNDDGMPVLALFNERTVSIFDTLFDMLETPGSALVGGINNPVWGNPNHLPIFRQGRALFIHTGMGAIEDLRDMDDEIGIVPTPKFDENTPRFFSLVEAYGGLLTVPVTVSDFERTSIITEALAAGGHKIVIPAYFEMALKTKYARDYESEEMLDIIRASAIYDFGYLNHVLAGDPLSSIGAHLVSTNNRGFATVFERNVDAAQRNIDRFIEDMAARY